MGAFDGFRIQVSGMDAQLQRLRVISSNLANIHATSPDKGQVYRRLQAVFESVPLENGSGDWPGADGGLTKVEVRDIVQDPTPLKRVYMPGHPDADPQGYVHYPNVESVTEMVDMMDAIRTYEANVTAFNASKDMIKRALEIGR